MRVAKYWRNRKLRYRLIRKMEGKGNRSDRLVAKDSGSASPDYLPEAKPVKVLL